MANQTQKSGTPMPTAPAAIQRTGTGASRGTGKKAGSAKKKKGPSLIRRFFMGLARRLFFGGKTLVKCLLLVPIVVFMVALATMWTAAACSRVRWHPAVSWT